MKQKRLEWMGAVVVVCVAAVLVSACAKTAGASVTLRETDTGRTIELKRGDKLIVQLEGNPTTGYSWTVEAVEGDIVKAEGEPEFTGDPGKIGGPGTFTFTFAATRTGRAELKLLYHQAWDKDTPPAKTFGVTVAVE